MIPAFRVQWKLLSWIFKIRCIFSVRLDLGSILGGLSNQGQQNNNNNNRPSNGLNGLISQGINLVATNPDVQQGLLNAVGVNLPINRPTQATTRKPVTQGMHSNYLIQSW